jgi:hypothetical protein
MQLLGLLNVMGLLTENLLLRQHMLSFPIGLAHLLDSRVFLVLTVSCTYYHTVMFVGLNITILKLVEKMGLLKTDSCFYFWLVWLPRTHCRGRGERELYNIMQNNI